jgi:hypothetical protein
MPACSPGTPALPAASLAIWRIVCRQLAAAEQARFTRCVSLGLAVSLDLSLDLMEGIMIAETEMLLGGSIAVTQKGSWSL